MKKYFDNLRPFEKRVVVVVGLTCFVVLNFWFVIPHFSDWSKVQARMLNARRDLAKYDAEIAQTETYKRKIAELGGALEVPLEDQASQFQQAVLKQAGQSGVMIVTTSRQQSSTNQFFLELSQNYGVQGKEPELVDFLFNLGSGASLIRVRDMSLHPDPPRQQLNLNVKLVASYQKAPPKRQATPPKVAAAESSNSTDKRL